MTKRKLDFNADTGRDEHAKRPKVRARNAAHPDDAVQNPSTSGPAPDMDPVIPSPSIAVQDVSMTETENEGSEPVARGSHVEGKTGRTHKVRKLVPPRPFPTVPPSVSATGPRSAHVEGKNYICVTRRTELGAYLRRCKDVFLKDGYVPRPVFAIC